MKKRRKPRILARLQAALSDAAEGAVDAMAAYANRPIAAEVDNERERWSPLAYVHHQRDLMRGDKRALKGRKEWMRRLSKMERSSPDEWAAYMLEVDKHIDAGELVPVLPADEMERVRERARESGPRVTAEAINAPYMGVTPAEVTQGRTGLTAEQRDAIDAQSARELDERWRDMENKLGRCPG